MCLFSFNEFIVCLYNKYTVKLYLKKLFLMSAILIDTVLTKYRSTIFLIENVLFLKWDIITLM